MMLDTLLEAASYLLSTEVWLVLIIGCVIGLVFGALPGLSGVTAMALVLPFTYGWDPMIAFFLFAGILGATSFGASIPAILINTPGTAPNAATCLDGYPMAQRGEGGRALGISATASALGAIFGIVILVVLIPLVIPFVLAFRAPEFLMMILLGLTCVSFAARGNMIKGLVAGAVGILLSLVGWSNVFGELRFNFGSLYLWDGIQTVPFVIGFFALSEMLRLSIRGGVIREKISGKLSGTLEGVKDVFRHPVTFVRGSAIGTVVGIIPGVGGTVANFLAYIAEVQASKHPETFGTGEVRGVIAPEAANDSKDGGALLPTIAFGIPGSAVMIMLLGAFVLHGLHIGPLFLETNLDIVWALIFGLVISNILVSALGVAAGKYMAWITTINVAYLIPVIVSICFAGAFFLRGNIVDVVISVFAGFLGYGLQRFGFSRVCCVIGFVLGHLAESSFTQSLQISYGSYSIFFTRPISLVLFILFILILLLPLFNKLRAKDRSKAQ
ncbi:tripartite tricarboxylate transporter permease [Chloroflexota bacterium]